MNLKCKVLNSWLLRLPSLSFCPEAVTLSWDQQIRWLRSSHALGQGYTGLHCTTCLDRLRFCFCDLLVGMKANKLWSAGHELITAVTTKSAAIFWGMTLCTLVYISRAASCFLLVTCLTFSSTLKTEAVHSSETPVNLHQTTWRHIPKGSILHASVPPWCGIQLTEFNITWNL
jgi:hypothetical protein